MTKNGHGAIFYYVHREQHGYSNHPRKTLPGLGYELVDFELAAQGTLRVFIDKEGGITVEDCATVSNHLSRVFMVEDIGYKTWKFPAPDSTALEKAADFVRFAGQNAKIKPACR
ncbi:Ribosome maturation factor RimP [Neisseria gonorrhoeae]|uniref:Ribosome maturation factor RimP n=1 Tax=Neisseria gonorrhoeae TaxID=485 RepID=A0A379B1E1_NEIGO|nr:Ribosome maturation factor RimP [Neisseria gonorrhoeae]